MAGDDPMPAGDDDAASWRARAEAAELKASVAEQEKEDFLKKSLDSKAEIAALQDKLAKSEAKCASLLANEEAGDQKLQKLENLLETTKRSVFEKQAEVEKLKKVASDCMADCSKATSRDCSAIRHRVRTSVLHKN